MKKLKLMTIGHRLSSLLLVLISSFLIFLFFNGIFDYMFLFFDVFLLVIALSFTVIEFFYISYKTIESHNHHIFIYSGWHYYCLYVDGELVSETERESSSKDVRLHFFYDTCDIFVVWNRRNKVTVTCDGVDIYKSK